MKALTIREPFATLVAAGVKRIETRSWRTHYRGPLVIHAAAKLVPTDPFLLAQIDWEEPELLAAGIRPILTQDLSPGHLLGVCDLVNVTPVEKLADYLRESPSFRDRLELFVGDFSPGRYAWMLRRRIRFGHTWPAKGSLGLWEVPGPERVLNGVLEALKTV